MVPSDLEELRQIWIAKLLASEMKHLILSERHQLYEAIEKKWGHDLLKWLGYYTADFVLPIFTQALPKETTAPRSVMLVRRILEHKISIDSKRVENYLELTYHTTGNFWGHDEEDIPDNVYFAGCASRAALLQACNYFCYKNKDCSTTIDPTEGFFANGDPVCGAVLALARIPNWELDTSRTLEFWLWWLNEGLNKAWYSYEANLLS